MIQRIQQLLMDPAEAAIGEHGDDVTGAARVLHLFHDLIDAGQITTVAAMTSDIGGEFFRGEPVVCENLVEVGNGNHLKVG